MANLIDWDFYAAARPGTSPDPAMRSDIDRLIAVASAWVRQECGRTFDEIATTATARSYVPPANGDTIVIDDFGSLTGLTVVDYTTTLTIDRDFYALPIDGASLAGDSAWSCWYMLRRFYGNPWLNVGRGATVTVTAKWGIPTTSPMLALAKQACVEVVADLQKVASNNFGVIGITDGLAVRLRSNTHVAELLTTCVRADRSRRWAVA